MRRSATDNCRRWAAVGLAEEDSEAAQEAVARAPKLRGA
eukprot:CAMPEP_0170147896 /NCGR_PEP_ID=MMETSP0033_2-20121228/36364_1 /TAXON_ID=195969 /ORGANISM="Dolichomastix tenuilepis, Strain CCMP3274" /LENGTH=38 /DNA_ID= /DNA_START= /DNA_END= /DNA_ORIENTATION=